MERKILGILFCMLLIITAFSPVVGTINVGKTKIQEGTTENVGLAPASTLCQGDGNEADEDWSILGVTVSTNDPPPDKPDKPCGPTRVKNETMCTYNTEANGQHQHKICYNFSWGDGTHSGWTGVHNCGEKANASHKWNKTGNYMIKAKARYEHCHEESEWSEPLGITVSTGDPANDPPNEPIITGPTSGKFGEEHEYTFSAVDPDGDDVYLLVKWKDDCSGCEWIGPYGSGEEVVLNHIFSEQGTYTIRAKAKDVYDAESNWAALEVSMPKSKVVVKSAPILFAYIDVRCSKCHNGGCNDNGCEKGYSMWYIVVALGQHTISWKVDYDVVFCDDHEDTHDIGTDEGSQVGWIGFDITQHVWHGFKYGDFTVHLYVDGQEYSTDHVYCS